MAIPARTGEVGPDWSRNKLERKDYPELALKITSEESHYIISYVLRSYYDFVSTFVVVSCKTEDCLSEIHIKNKI